MEIITKDPQPRPILGVCFPQIFLRGHNAPYIETPDQAPLAILKYFPKNIDSLPSELYHRTLKTRIKRLKLIKTIPSAHPNKTLRILLKDQRKNIKLALGVRDLDCRGEYNKRNFQLLKMFPNAQKVEFWVINQYYEDEERQRSQAKRPNWINRMSNYLNGMTHLKHLKFSNRGFYLLPLLSKLNSFEAMLSRLEVFKLDFKTTRSEDFPDLQALLSYKTVLKNLTHLKLNLPEEEEFFPAFQLLSGLCPRLLSLFYCINQYQDFWTFEEISYLKCLQSFQNLQKLSLYCDNKLDAFRHCKFPTSLRFLDLFFYGVEWQNLIAEDSSTLPVFHHKQEGLENLEKLQISLYNYHPTTEEEIIKDFIKDLLGRILVLREFNMEFLPQIQEENSSYPFDLSRFLGFFQHLSQSLQRLTINDRCGKYQFTNFSETHTFHFAELSYLSLEGATLSSLPEIENIIKLVQVRPSAPVPEIKLKRIRIDSWKALLELFNSLKRISEKNIELGMFYERMEEDDNDEYFKENYEQVKEGSRNLRNVTLQIRFGMGWPRFRWMKELRSLENLFRNLMLTEHVYV